MLQTVLSKRIAFFAWLALAVGAGALPSAAEEEGPGPAPAAAPLPDDEGLFGPGPVTAPVPAAPLPDEEGPVGPGPVRTPVAAAPLPDEVGVSDPAPAVMTAAAEEAAPPPVPPAPSALPGPAAPAPLPYAPGLSDPAAVSAAVPPAENAAPCPEPCGGACRCGKHGVCLGEAGFGDSVRAAFGRQIANGAAARMVLYRYDFCDPASTDNFKLNAHGAARLAEIVKLFCCAHPRPIVIECTQDAALDAARRTHVAQALGRMNVPVPDALVVVGASKARPLAGEEALEIYRNLLEQTRQGGATPPTPISNGGGSDTMTSGAPSGGGYSGQ